MDFRFALFAAGCVLLISVAQAQLQLNTVFTKTSAISAANGFAYHAPSDTVLIASASSNGEVYRFNGSDGNSTTPATMAKGSLTFGGLGIFSLGTTSDGQIIGFDNGDGTNPATKQFVFWSGVGATPTASAVPALTPPAFPRNMDAADVATASSGTQTLLALSGGNDDADPLQVWLKGTPYGEVALAGGSAGNLGCKAGAAISDDGQWLVGCNLYDPHWGVHVFRNGTGGPLSSYNWTLWRDIDIGQPYADVAVDSATGVGIGLKLSTSSFTLVAFSLATGQIFDTTEVTQASTGDRGSLDIDRSKKRLYWLVRQDSATAAFGRYDYMINAPTNAQDWQLLE